MVSIQKFILLLFFSFFIFISVTGQTINNKGEIEMRFLKDMVETKSGKTFFNILFLKNKSSQEISFNIQFNTPRNWIIIGSSYEEITLPANADISLPVRVSVSKDANGGVGYAVVAVLTDNKGSVYDSEYCFIHIPVNSSVNVKTTKKSRYFDHKTLKSSFSVTIENSGNIDEIINIKIIPDKSIKLPEGEENIFVEEKLVKSGKTETFIYEAQLNKDIDFKKYRIHKINFEVSFRDSVISKTIWFKYLDWKYKNIYPEQNYPLNIELSGYNILGGSTPIYIGKVFGNILLKNRRYIEYSFENYNQDPSTNSLWINSRFKVSYNSPKTSVFFGDYTGNFEHSMYGRGIYLAQKFGEKVIIKGVATQRIIQNINNFGLSYAQNLSAPISYELGGVYSQLPTQGITSALGYGQLKTKIFKQNLMILLGNSQSTNNQLSENNQYSGWGYRMHFIGKFKSLSFNIRSHYGTPNYWGYSQGRHYTESYINLPVSDNKLLVVQYFNQRYRPAYISDNILYQDRFTNYQQLKTQIIYRTTKNINIIGGPIFDEQNTNIFSAYPVNEHFASVTGKINLGVRVFNKFANNSFSVSAKYGITNIYDYSLILNEISYESRIGKTTYNVSEIAASFRQKNFGIHLNYHNGPYNISQQFSYLYNFHYPRSLSIIPYYEKELIADKVILILRGSYIHNITSKNSRININTGINWYAGRGWSFRFLNTSSVHRVNNNSGSASFSSTYFEFGILKSFNIPQPRLKYYDLNVVYYKDFNGNRIHDPNEPGVNSVLTDIRRANPIEDNNNPNYNGEFLANELLSNQEGIIQYENIAEGEYKIQYTPQRTGLNGFDTEGSEKSFIADKDTVLHIPFLERNKLFGKVNLNRTKHSALGEIPIDNIKIIVEGNNKSYSSLTDPDGNFEMYIPVADYYKVKITNIFHEHFDLRHEYYIVKFNGYKQFELSFDFDEKERKIAFDESDFLIDDDDIADDDFTFDDIKVIKQTNLKGIIKDANSLLPIHATISVYNASGELISETASSNRTGVYFTSFFAGDDYSLKASSKGYWVFKENLNIQQVTTFENINIDVMLKKINIDDEIKSDKLRFESESAVLTPLLKAELDNMLSMLFLNPSVHIEISGHTDNIETLLTNAKQLSGARAGAVAAYLVKNGLKEKRIKIVAMGNSNPKNLDDSEEGRSKNRRVDIKVAGF